MNELTKPESRRPGWFYRWMMSLLGIFDGWLHMSCRSFIQVASEKYERPLRPLERVRQAIHRAMCRLCRVQEKRMDQLRELARDVGRTDIDEVDTVLSDEATERIRLAMVQEAERRDTGDSCGDFHEDQ